MEKRSRGRPRRTDNAIVYNIGVRLQPEVVGYLREYSCEIGLAMGDVVGRLIEQAFTGSDADDSTPDA